jgi:hypothetical protein
MTSPLAPLRLAGLDIEAMQLESISAIQILQPQ